MKKKLTLTLLTFVLAFSCAFGFAACDLFGGQKETITLNNSELTMKLGESISLVSRGGSGVTWKSSDSSVVRVVYNKGGDNFCELYAFDAGLAEITATAQNGDCAICVVTVLGIRQSGVAGMRFTCYKVISDEDYSEFEHDKASLLNGKIFFDLSSSACAVISSNPPKSTNGIYGQGNANDIVYVTVNDKHQLFTVRENRLITEVKKGTATLTLYYKVMLPELPPDDDEPMTGIVGKTFIFDDVTSEDGYPFLDIMIDNMKGQEITFQDDGTFVTQDSYGVGGVYTVQGNTVTLTSETTGGQVAVYTIQNNSIFTETEISYQDRTYTVKVIYRLKTADDELLL